MFCCEAESHHCLPQKRDCLFGSFGTVNFFPVRNWSLVGFCKHLGGNDRGNSGWFGVENEIKAMRKNFLMGNDRGIHVFFVEMRKREGILTDRDHFRH